MQRNLFFIEKIQKSVKCPALPRHNEDLFSKFAFLHGDYKVSVAFPWGFLESFSETFQKAPLKLSRQVPMRLELFSLLEVFSLAKSFYKASHKAFSFNLTSNESLNGLD